MKINVLRNLVIPWMMLFSTILIGAIVTGVHFHLQATNHSIYFIAVGLGVVFCLGSNINTLSTAGIWITHSLPSSLRYNSWPWLFSALRAAILGLIVFLIGQWAFVPLFWQAFVIPIIFTFCLFLIIWRLMGPLLTWSSTLNFSRVSAWSLSLPVFALVPLTAIFLGQNIVTAYFSSRPDLVMIAVTPKTSAAILRKKTEPETAVEVRTPLPPVIEKRMAALQGLAESGRSCAEESKTILAALEPKAPDEVVYWAIQALKCADAKSIVALPKLVNIMMGPGSPKVRAAAIRMMPRYGTENVKRVAYLLYKRMGENNPNEVIKASAVVLVGLGEDERKSAHRRLQGLLDSKTASPMAAEVLVTYMKQEDMVAEYVVQSLSGPIETRERAVGMICQLPKKSRALAEPFIDQVVASVKTGAEEDPAMMALDCLGAPGFHAIQQEVIKPQKLERPIAARALSEMDVKQSPEALETAGTCVRDTNDQVRQYCSQSLGKIGATALPKIMDLLKSNDSNLKDAGRRALGFLNDPLAKPELERIRADNSGWMANKKKLQLAEAIDTALLKIELEKTENVSGKADRHDN